MLTMHILSYRSIDYLKLVSVAAGFTAIICIEYKQSLITSVNSFCSKTVASCFLCHTVGQTDVLGFRSMALSEADYVSGVSLALTDRGINSPVYYIVVKAVNGAGKHSTLMSSQ